VASKIDTLHLRTEATWDILGFGEERRRLAAAARTTGPAVNVYLSCTTRGGSKIDGRENSQEPGILGVHWRPSTPAMAALAMSSWPVDMSPYAGGSGSRG
jgi:hypothetical protein